MTLILDIIKSGKNRPEHKSFRFEQTGGTIGRSDEADYLLTDPQNHISGVHLEVQFQDNAYYLLDSSTNGTFLKNPYQRLSKGNPYSICTSDIFIVGDHELQARLDDNNYTDDYIVGNLTPVPEPLAAIEELIPDDDFLYDDAMSHSTLFGDSKETKSIDDVIELCNPASIILDEFPSEMQSDEEIRGRESFGEYIRIPSIQFSSDDLLSILEKRLGFSMSTMSDDTKQKLINDIADVVLSATQSLSPLSSIQKTIQQNSVHADV